MESVIDKLLISIEFPLTDFTIVVIDGIVNITEEFVCKVVSDGQKFHITDGVLVK